LLEDLGLQYDFVSTQQILDGTLAKRGYKALILPESLAIGNAEAAKITAYADAGGTVIADFLPGVFDEHGKRREKGVLDGFLGIAQPSGKVEQPETSAVAKLAIRDPRKAGKGQAYYLNISPLDYAKLRLEGKGEKFRRVIGTMLTAAGAKPAVTVTLADGPPIGCEVITYHGSGKRYVAIMRNPEYNVSELGELGYGNNARFEKPVTVQLTLGSPANAKELLTGKEFKGAKSFEVRLEPWTPVIVEVR